VGLDLSGGGHGDDRQQRLHALSAALQSSAAQHDHLCPRQVLGVRMGLLGGELLELDVPRRDRRLIVIAETDGCFVDGIWAATGCSVGHRNLRVEDLGKAAVTMVDAETERAIRLWPAPEARQMARRHAPETTTRWEAYLVGYQRMPAKMLIAWRPVQLLTPAAWLLSKPDHRAVCESCGEEVINDREIVTGGVVQCGSCAGRRYYVEVSAPALTAMRS
jgi:formylmethanofuran dehydrogenase subunit E